MQPMVYQSLGFLLGGGIRENAILGAGCKVLFQDDLVIGKGTVIGVNSVLLCSTGENEIWAGIPAKCVGKRE